MKIEEKDGSCSTRIFRKCDACLLFSDETVEGGVLVFK
jgi:hypothetical protein